ncbi:unnamed protein product, partial [Sphagnum tenellum]
FLEAMEVLLFVIKNGNVIYIASGGTGGQGATNYNSGYIAAYGGAGGSPNGIAGENWCYRNTRYSLIVTGGLVQRHLILDQLVGTAGLSYVPANTGGNGTGPGAGGGGGVGAGGGGGGGTQNNNGGGGGGGGSGGYLQSQVLSVNQGDTITIVVGAGGAAQTVANNTSPGGTGGTTTVSQNGAVQFTVTGGAGGLYATSNGGGFGGAGGSPNGAAGGEGGHGTSDTSSDSGGAGGSTPFGQGGAGGAGTAGAEHGSNGSGPGAGGGGGGDADRGGAGDDGLGGNGADGGVEIVSFGVALSGATAVANPDSYNLLTAIQATGQWDGVTPVSATVLCGGAQIGTNSTTPAFSTGSLPANSSLTLTINSGCSINGTSGGAALNIQCPTTIINNGSINGPIIGVLLGSGSFNGSSNTNIPFTLNRSGVAAGTYTAPTITIQSDGRITSATSGGSVGAGQIINALGYTPANDALVVHIAGDTMTGTLTISGANLNVLSPGSIMQNNNTLLPSGCIVMWNGSSAPAGWQLCDGTNGTPDLRGSFIVSQGGPNGYSVGQTGGANFISTTTGAAGAHTHTMDVQGSHNHGGSDGSTVLDITMIPSHTHGFGTSQNVKTGTQTSYASGGDNSVWDNPSPALTGATGGGLGHNHSISTDGSHQHNITAVGDHTHSVSFDNRPAFYVLAYIMKL